MTVHRDAARRRPRGFTLFEVGIVIIVIAVLTAVLLPYIRNAIETARIATTRGALSDLSYNMKRVYRDSGYWPYESTVWSAAPNFPYPQIEPRAFNSGDTAMVANNVPVIPVGFPAVLPCTQVPPGATCWAAPYLPQLQGSMASLTDPWGHPFMYAYIRPADGLGGGTTAAPNGFVIIWSLGPDGLDQTGCSSGGCPINYTNMAQGLSSVPFCSSPDAIAGACSDDIVQFVAPAQGDITVAAPFIAQ